jgi:hypothetical protein
MTAGAPSTSAARARVGSSPRRVALTLAPLPGLKTVIADVGPVEVRMPHVITAERGEHFHCWPGRHCHALTPALCLVCCW